MALSNGTLKISKPTTEGGVSFPDYARGPVSVPNNWTAQDDGWLMFNKEYNGAVSVSGYINSRLVYHSNWGGGSMAPISKGDVVTFSGEPVVVFYPCRT